MLRPGTTTVAAYVQRAPEGGASSPSPTTAGGVVSATPERSATTEPAPRAPASDVTSITGPAATVTDIPASGTGAGAPWPLAVAMLVVFALLATLGEWIAMQGALVGWTWFAALFVGGWILQLVGHVFEGRKPALADNLFQIFVAPIFLAAEVFFALGYKPGLHSAVQSRALRLRTHS